MENDATEEKTHDATVKVGMVGSAAVGKTSIFACVNQNAIF
jgi:hypothetical protein